METTTTYGFPVPHEYGIVHIMDINHIAGYSVIRPIFRGGMTDLFIATNQQQKRVVIRILKEAYASDRRIRKNFLKSAEILGHLTHPNIVRLIATGTVDGTPYMVMEYIDGLTLRDMLLKRDTYLSEHLMDILTQMAAALYHVHFSGYLHLDFKPENLMRSPEGQVILIDFELALKRRCHPVRLSTFSGTPSYLAPEFMTRQKVDDRADIFSFGVTAYELLTFHKPFERDTLDASRIAQTCLDVEPDAIDHYTPQAPQALQDIILKCLAKDVERRYPSMSLIVKALRSMP